MTEIDYMLYPERLCAAVLYLQVLILMQCPTTLFSKHDSELFKGMHQMSQRVADDTTLLYGQHSSVDISRKYENICSWSIRNKLRINAFKTKEIIFYRPSSRHLIILHPLPGSEQISLISRLFLLCLLVFTSGCCLISGQLSVLL